MPTQVVVLVADRSGSMRGKEVDTVGGLNSCIDELKTTKGENDNIKVTLKLFDHEQINVWNSVPLETVENFQVSNFIPRGQTALYDAMGDSIKEYFDMKELDNTAFDSCCIYVSTDGCENASKKWRQDSLKELIKQAEELHNIKVMYLGANQDAILAAASVGISADRAINYNESGETIQAVYRAAANSAVRTRSGQSSGFMQAERQASQPSHIPSPPTVTRMAAVSNGTFNVAPSTILPRIPPPPPSPYSVSQVQSLPSRLSSNNSLDMAKQHQILDAGKNNQWDVVEAMLNENSNLINVEGGLSKRWTLLHQAAYSNNYSMVEKLLLKGADKTIRNREGQLASELTTNQAIQILLNNDQAVAVN